MENLLLLAAAVLIGSCVIVVFIGKTSIHSKILPVLWTLSSASVTAAAFLLVFHLLNSDFNYLYVYNHSDLSTAPIYKISALWSGQEGSFLLWAFILAIMGFIVLNQKGSRKPFGIYCAVCFFIDLMCFFTKPFEKTAAAYPDGLGLNEALKDPWMVMHPPLIFISYSAMAILFSFFIVSNKASFMIPHQVAPDQALVYGNKILLWQRISFVFLGAGILTGSVWAYRALGWGGYWAWDPIENAALVPWLLLCGYLHRKDLHGRTACMLPFCIACLGVFLARSGILQGQSAHAYTAGNIIISAVLLCFLTAVLFFLIITGIQSLKRQKEKPKWNTSIRKLMFFSINGYAALILLGTVSPLILRFNIPTGFYNSVSILFILIYTSLLLAYDIECIKKRSITMMVTSAILTVFISILSSSAGLVWLILIWLVLLPLSLWLVSGFRNRSYQYYLSHCAVILLMIGAVASSVLGKESFLIADPDNAVLQVEGAAIPSEKFIEKGMIIKTMPLKDILVKCSDLSMTAEGILLPYETKPLILLFWAGSFLLIIQPLICLAVEMCRKNTFKRFSSHNQSAKNETPSDS